MLRGWWKRSNGESPAKPGVVPDLEAGPSATPVEDATLLPAATAPVVSTLPQAAPRSLVRPIAAGLASISVHLVALVILAGVTLDRYPQVLAEIQAMMRDEPEPEPLEVPTDLTIAEPDEERSESVRASEAFSIATLSAEEPKVEELVVVEDVAVPELTAMSVEEVRGLDIDELIQRQGSAGEEVMTVEGAVDRITHEIALNLEQGNLLVVWLMDMSISLVDDREAVADRLARVFDELGQLGSLQGDHLLSAVVGFGLETKFLLAPSNKAEETIEAIREVPIDNSGVENVFTAVIESLNKYKGLKARQDRRLMFVVWTDEAGDDHDRLEEAIRVCQKVAVPVFTVGPSAVFGRRKGIHAYRHPDDGEIYPIEVDRGPDTATFELLRVPYWFEGPQLEHLSAGIGPFALTRFAVQTGGGYFINDPKEQRSRFSLDAMRPYMPEYTTAEDYQREINRSPLRQAVVRAAQATLAREMKGTPQLEFEPTGENFQNQLSEAQQSVAFNNIVLAEALAAFPPRGLEQELAEEKSPRWRAWHDLTLGRLLAMQVRCNEYNWACAEMKGKGADFVNQQSNRWTFKPSDKLRPGAGSAKQAEQAKQLLERCIAEHPNTPWEALAKRELAYPLGFEIEERYVPRPEEMAGPGVDIRQMGRRMEQLRQLPRRQMDLPKL